MKSTTATNPLSITVSPATVYISTNPEQFSYANISLNINNTGNGPVSLNGVAITLPAVLAPANFLNSINPAVSPAGLWTFGPSQINAGEFDAMPQSGNSVILKANDIWQFTLNNITLVSAITRPTAQVTVTITYPDGSTETEPLTINIAQAPASIVFKAEPSNIDPGATATLSWACENMDYCVLDPPDCGCTNTGGNGLLTNCSCQVSPTDTSSYTLYAYGDGVILSAQWTITVEDPKIIKFGGAEGQHYVDYGEYITLVWECNRFTRSIEITDDQDVTIPDYKSGGNTPQQGSIKVGPIITATTFTLNAYGSNVQNFDQRTPTINVNDLKCTFVATPGDGLWQKDKVTLNWDIKSASSVSISPPITNGPSMQNLSNTVDIYPEESVVYTLSIAGFVANDPVSKNLPVTLNITPVLIKVNFSISPEIIDPFAVPNQATLSWDTQAQLVSIDNNIGEVSPVSTWQLTEPPDQTIYTLFVGTIQNPHMITQSVTINSFCGPYYFNGFTGEQGNVFCMKNSSRFIEFTKKHQKFDSFYVLLTGVKNIPQPALVGWYTAYEPYSFGIIGFYDLQWADPANPIGSLTILNQT